MTKKRPIAPILAALVTALLAGGALAQATQLTIWVRTPETFDLIASSIDRFHAANPDVRVRMVTFAADAYPGALQAAISGRDLPAVFQVHNSVPVPRLVSLGLIQPLPHVRTCAAACIREGSTGADPCLYPAIP